MSKIGHKIKQIPILKKIKSVSSDVSYLVESISCHFASFI